MNILAKALELDDRQFYGLLAAVSLLLIVTAVSFILLPQVRIHNAAVAARVGLPSLPGDAATLQVLLSDRNKALDDRSRQVHGDMANLPIREIEAFVIDRLQGIAWNHSVVLQGVQPSSGETIESFREILFKLELTGHYSDLFAWLNELRAELGFIVIKEYQMDRLSDNAEDPILRAQLTIASYRKERL